jgi:hypothetical protein
VVSRGSTLDCTKELILFTNNRMASGRKRKYGEKINMALG